MKADVGSDCGVVWYTSSLCAKLCHINFHAAAIRTDPPTELQEGIEKQHATHGERCSEAFSLDLALYSKMIVHFYSSIGDKL